MNLKNKRVSILMIRTRIAPTTFRASRPRVRTRIRRSCKDDWSPDEQQYINENKEWKWYLPEEEVWDLDSIREASGYKKESLEIMLELMTSEEEQLVTELVEKLEEYAEKYVDENNN